MVLAGKLHIVHMDGRARAAESLSRHAQGYCAKLGHDHLSGPTKECLCLPQSPGPASRQ
jgi:hypothetical protein